MTLIAIYNAFFKRGWYEANPGIQIEEPFKDDYQHFHEYIADLGFWQGWNLKAGKEL